MSVLALASSGHQAQLQKSFMHWKSELQSTQPQYYFWHYILQQEIQQAFSLCYYYPASTLQKIYEDFNNYDYDGTWVYVL